MLGNHKALTTAHENKHMIEETILFSKRIIKTCTKHKLSNSRTIETRFSTRRAWTNGAN